MTNKSQNQDDINFISKLAKVLTENDLSEIEVARNLGSDLSLEVRLSRQSAVMPQSYAAPMPSPVAAPLPAEPVSTNAAAAAPTTDDAGFDENNLLRAPMVGTVYMASEPNAPNFVSVGDKVNAGDTVLIIEAMKTMNQIAAHKSGTVQRILTENAHPVEFGDPLIIIE